MAATQKRFLRKPRTTAERREVAAAKVDDVTGLRKRARPTSYDDLNVSADCEQRARAKAKAKAKKARRN